MRLFGDIPPASSMLLQCKKQLLNVLGMLYEAKNIACTKIQRKGTKESEKEQREKDK
jgi:hypothetical protein